MSDLNVDDIQERVTRIEDRRAPYVRAAQAWEKMWALDPYTREEKTRARAMDKEQVILPTPYNVVHMARRLINTDPKIEIPGRGGLDDDSSARTRQRWLTAFFQRTNHQQRRDLVGDATFHSLVRGRCAFEVKWVDDVLPERLKGQRLPLLVRTLDPMNIGVSAGPLYTEYAYHRYTDSRGLIRQRYPKMESRRASDDDDEVEVIDYWWVNTSDGTIWNAVVVDDVFAKQPAQTDYPDIPIIEGYGDSSPIESEEYRSLSILHPIKDIWPYACRLSSLVGTGLLFYFWPAVIVTNESGLEVPNLEFRPGTTTTLPTGTKVDMLRGDVNVPLAQQMMGQIQQQLDLSTFPGVMYGQSPGDLQAGYGVSILADQARGRVNQFRNGLETALEHVNEVILGLVEKMAGGAGVTVWGKTAAEGKLFSETLKPSDIDGDYSNLVSLTPTLANDDVQRQTLGLRMVEAGIISKRTFRDKFISIAFPEDEKIRIDLEQAEASGELAPVFMLKALQESYPKDWDEIIKGTPVEEVAQRQEPQQPGPGMMPPGMPPGGPQMPPGMPPGMAQGGPGMPPGMMGPPMPPQAQGGPGMPPGMAAQAPGMVPGLPPEMQGQLTPEMLGILPGMEQQMPGIYNEMVGRPLSPEEELARLAGIPPQLR